MKRSDAEGVRGGYRPEFSDFREDGFRRCRAGESLMRTPSMAVELSTVRRMADSRAVSSRRNGLNTSNESLCLMAALYHFNTIRPDEVDKPGQEGRR